MPPCARFLNHIYYPKSATSIPKKAILASSASFIISHYNTPNPYDWKYQ